MCFQEFTKVAHFKEIERAAKMIEEFFNHFGGTLNFFEVPNFCEVLKSHFGMCENQFSSILEKIKTSPIGVVMYGILAKIDAMTIFQLVSHLPRHRYPRVSSSRRKENSTTLKPVQNRTGRKCFRKQ